MNKRSILVFIAASLVMLIPSPGRFVYGFTLVLEFNLAILVGTLMNSLVLKLKLEKIHTTLILFAEIAFTICYRQLLILICPEVMLVLGFNVYILPLSYFVVGYLFFNTDKDLVYRLKFNFFYAAEYSVYALVFFLFRDIVGFGTITFFGRNHQIAEKVLINPEKNRLAALFASIPGAFILFGIVLLSLILIRNKLEIVRKKEAAK